MENRFDLDDINYQDCITIDKKDMIVDFYESYVDYFKEDIIDFENYYKNFNIDNAIELVIWVSDCHDNKIDFNLFFLMNDSKKIYFSIKCGDMVKWLEKNNLITGDKSKWELE